MGLANALNGRLDDAAEFFTEALDINPQHVLAIRDLAFVYSALHKLKEASEILDRGIKFVGDNPELKTIRRKIRRSQIARQLADLFGHKKT